MSSYRGSPLGSASVPVEFSEEGKLISYSERQRLKQKIQDITWKQALDVDPLSALRRCVF